MKRLFLLLKSKRWTQLLLTLSIFWALLIMYGGAGLRILAGWGMTTTLAGLAVSIISCTAARWKVLSRRPAGRTKGLLGSVVFHLGLLVMLVGFLVNSLWSYQGVVFLPEGEVVQMPGEYQLQQPAVLTSLVPEFQVSLLQLANTQQIDQQGNALSRPQAKLQFVQNGVREQREVEINYPAYFQGLSWRQLSWGYSLLLTLNSPSGAVVKDYVNIATHTVPAQDGSASSRLEFYDVVPVSPNLILDVHYEPQAVGASPNRRVVGDFPKRKAANAPQIRLKLLGRPPVSAQEQLNGQKQLGRQEQLNRQIQQQVIGQSTIPLGSSAAVGSYTVKFEQVRYWQALDVSYDPGRWLLYLGGLLAVGGLSGTVNKYQAWGSEEQRA